MPENPDPQVILITGTSSGIGRLAAETLARAGHSVYASMRDPSLRNREVAETLAKIPVRVIDLDVTQTESVRHAVQTVIDEAGRLDVVVNNAGHMSIGIAEAFTEAQVQQQMEVNFLGPVRMCRAVLPHMRQRGKGLIIHVTSVVGRVLFPACAFYCASKFALEAYAEVLHYELSGLGVESVIVEPGPFPTRLLANSPEPADRTRAEAYGGISQLREVFADTFSKFLHPSRARTRRTLRMRSRNLSACRRESVLCGPCAGQTTARLPSTSTPRPFRLRCYVVWACWRWRKGLTLRLGISALAENSQLSRLQRK